MSDLEGEKKRRVDGDSHADSAPETRRLHFHYDREERLKKLRTLKDKAETGKKGRFVINKKSRRLFILLANMALIYAIIFAYMKPSNVYIRQQTQGRDFELNVTTLRGKKTLVGFTVRNGKGEDLVFQYPVPVSLMIRDRSGKQLTFRKYIEKDTVLMPEESTSVVFIFENRELPQTARLEVFYGGSEEPLFARNVRF